MNQIHFDGISDAFNVTGEITALTYGSYVPTRVIDCAKDWSILIKLRTTGANTASIAGDWIIEVRYEQMGPGPEGNIGYERIPLMPGPSPIEYGPVEFKVKGGWIFKEDGCGLPPGTYRIIITVQYLDTAGKPSPIAGVNDQLILHLFDGNISPPELPTDLLNLRAENIKVISALESSGFAWLTIEDVSKETGLSHEIVKRSIDSLNEHVLKNRLPDAQGCELYTTRARALRELQSMGKDSAGKDIDVRTAAKNAVSVGEPVVNDINKAYERIVGSTTSVLNQLEINYNQARDQAKGQYRLSLIAGGVGILLIGVAVITLLLGFTTAAIVTMIPSVVLDAMAAFFFRESRNANRRVDNITKKLDETREIHSLVEIVDTMTDEKSRDELKAEIVKKTLAH